MLHFWELDDVKGVKFYGRMGADLTASSCLYKRRGCAMPLLGDGAILCSFLNQVIGGWNERVWSVTMHRGWFTAKLAHYFGMIWALSAGREGLSPTQSLIGSGCLSLKVCVRVFACACAFLSWYACACCQCDCVCSFEWALCPVKRSPLLINCVKWQAWMCSTVCLRAGEL